MSALFHWNSTLLCILSVLFLSNFTLFSMYTFYLGQNSRSQLNIRVIQGNEESFDNKLDGLDLEIGFQILAENHKAIVEGEVDNRNDNLNLLPSNSEELLEVPIGNEIEFSVKKESEILAESQQAIAGRNKSDNPQLPERNIEMVPKVPEININDEKPSMENKTQVPVSLMTEQEYYQLRPTKVNPYNYKLLIQGNHICDEYTDLVIVVNSAPSHVAKRQAIRETWAGAAMIDTWPQRPINAQIKLVFVFGIDGSNQWNTRIAEEHVYFKDVIQGNFIDAYNNLTLKSLLAMKWVTEFCPPAQFVLKCDDDTFINMPYLISYLSRDLANEDHFILGFVNSGSEVLRLGKWKLSKDLFPFHVYPPYEGGSAYVMTADVTRELFAASEYVPAIYIDDVYITGILGRIVNVTHVHHPGFAWAYAPPPSLCDVLMGRTITFTRLQSKDVLTAWSVLSDSKDTTCETDTDLSQRRKETKLNYLKPWYKTDEKTKLNE